MSAALLLELGNSNVPAHVTTQGGSGAPAWFPVAFVGIWVAVCAVLSWLAGHMALLERFPPVDEPKEQSFFLASGAMRWGVHFNSALYVGIGATGLHLAPNWLFRPLFFRGIPCIPWRELRCARAQSKGFLGFFRPSAFELPTMSLRFRVAGAPGRAIEGKLAPFDESALPGALRGSQPSQSLR